MCIIASLAPFAFVFFSVLQVTAAFSGIYIRLGIWRPIFWALPLQVPVFLDIHFPAGDEGVELGESVSPVQVYHSMAHIEQDIDDSFSR